MQNFTVGVSKNRPLSYKILIFAAGYDMVQKNLTGQQKIWM